MAFVSQCVNCKTLTMMQQCPKCQGSTRPYDTGSGYTPKNPRVAFRGGDSGGVSNESAAGSNAAFDLHHQQQQQQATAALRSKTFVPASSSTNGKTGGGLSVASSSGGGAPNYVQDDVEQLHNELRDKEREIVTMRAEMEFHRRQQQQQQQHSAALSPAPAQVEARSSLDSDGGVRIASTQKELTAAWSTQVAGQTLQLQMASLRDKYNTLLSEKDQWMIDTLRQQEMHQSALSKLEEQYRESRRDAQQWQQRASELEVLISEAQRKAFDAEQHVQLYATRMTKATEEIRDLQRAVASSKEADRQDLERARHDISLHSRRTLELEEELRNTRLRIADLKDEVDAGTALRSSTQQKLSQAVTEREELAAANESLQRQLHLSVVEQKALGEEAKQLREKLLDATRRLDRLTEEKQHQDDRVASLSASLAAVGPSTEVGALRNQLEETQRDLQKSRDERSLALEAAETIRAEVRRLSLANNSLDDEVIHARQSNDALAKELGVLRNELRTVGSEFRAAHATAEEEHRRVVEALQQEVKRLEQSKQRLQEMMDRHGREVDVERAASEQTRFELRQQVEGLQAELQKKTNALEVAGTELERKRSLSPTRAEADRALMLDRVADLTKSVETLNRTLHEAKMREDALRMDVENAQRQLQAERLVKTNLDGLILEAQREAGNLYSKDELPNAIRSLIHERNVAVEERQALNSRFAIEAAHLQDEMAHLRTEIRALSTRDETQASQVNQLEKEVRAVQQDAEHRITETTRTWEVQMKRLEEEKSIQLRGRQEEIDRLRSAMEGIQSLHTTAEQRLQQEVAEKQRILKELQSSQCAIEGLRRQGDVGNARESELMHALQEQQLQLDASRNVERDLKNHIDVLRGENAQLRRDTETAAQLLAQALEEDRRVQEGGKRALGQEIESLKGQLKMERDRRALESDVSRTAEQRCLELEAQLEHARQERDHFQREYTTMKKTHASTVDAFQARIEDLEREGYHKEDRVVDLANRIAEKELHIAQLIEESGTSRQQAEVLEREKLLALRQMDAYQQQQRKGQSPPPTRGTSHRSDVGDSSSFARRVSPPRDTGATTLRSSAAGLDGVVGSYAPPPPQEPIPMPSMSVSKAGGGGTAARERNDALLAQFREQRRLTGGGPSSSSAAASGQQQQQQFQQGYSAYHSSPPPGASGFTATNGTNMSGGILLSSLRR